MADGRDQAITYAHEHWSEALDSLRALLAIPSVSTDPQHRQDMQHTADWLVNHLASKEIKAEKFQTAGHPIVYGEYLSAGPGAPTVLIYGHYDVQPPDPLEKWQTPPFQAAESDGYLYARGASDMKGRIIESLGAVDAILKQGKPGVNFKFIFEGEEEIGSPNLATFLHEHQSLLACDVALNPDSGMVAPDVPAITYSLRGLAAFELYVYGPSRDLHSGMFGGVVHNPAQALSELLAGLHNAEGSVTLPGFYDRVRPINSEEHAMFTRLPVDDAFYQKKTGAPALWGEPNFLPAERTGARPTLEINGMESGYTGVGTKTIIPSWAMAKISSRLVPDQRPDEVHQQFRQYLEQNAPRSIRWELKYLGGSPGVITDPQLPATRALATALQAVWGREPVLVREGGSIPVVVEMQEILNVPSVVTGFGLPDDNIHSPNERMNLATWKMGQDAFIHFFYNLAELESKK